MKFDRNQYLLGCATCSTSMRPRGGSSKVYLVKSERFSRSNARQPKICHTMTWGGQQMNKSAPYPTKTSLVPIQWPRRDGRLCWRGHELRSRNHESSARDYRRFFQLHHHTRALSVAIFYEFNYRTSAAKFKVLTLAQLILFLIIVGQVLTKKTSFSEHLL